MPIEQDDINEHPPEPAYENGAYWCRRGCHYYDPKVCKLTYQQIGPFCLAVKFLEMEVVDEE